MNFTNYRNRKFNKLLQRSLKPSKEVLIEHLKNSFHAFKFLKCQWIFRTEQKIRKVSGKIKIK